MTPSRCFRSGSGETLLVLDDDRAQLTRAEETMAALGYEPVGFTHARRGAGRLPGGAGRGSTCWCWTNWRR